MTTFDQKIPSKCPPKGAEVPNGVYFRFVFNNPPQPEDFVIWIDEPKNKWQLDKKKKDGDCGAFAISMLRKEGVKRAIELFGPGIRKKAEMTKFLGLAQVMLNSNSGMIKQTGSNPYHYDLWPYINSKLECNVVTVEVI